MPAKDDDPFLSAFIAIIPDTHVSDYTYLNLIEVHIHRIEALLWELDRRQDLDAAEMILAIWRRLRRYHELRGKYDDGVRIAPLFRRDRGIHRPRASRFLGWCGARMCAKTNVGRLP